MPYYPPPSMKRAVMVAWSRAEVEPMLDAARPGPWYAAQLVNANADIQAAIVEAVHQKFSRR